MTYISPSLRTFVANRAGDCCLSQTDVRFSFHVEHIIAEKHGGVTEAGNLAFSCPACNAYKGSDLSSVDWDDSEEIVPLYHPRRHGWSAHFQLSGAHIEPLTPQGRVTVFLLRLNAPERLAERALLIRLGSYPCSNS